MLCMLCPAAPQIQATEMTMLKVWHQDALEYYNNSGMVGGRGGRDPA